MDMDSQGFLSESSVSTPSHAPTPTRTLFLGIIIGSISTLLAMACLLGQKSFVADNKLNVFGLEGFASTDGVASMGGQRLILLTSVEGGTLYPTVEVPWTLTVEGGTLPNESYSSVPDLTLPTTSCDRVLTNMTLCPGCVPNDVDDSQVLSWAINLLTRGDTRAKLIGVSQTYGNADAASASHSLHRLMGGKGWKLEKGGRWAVWKKNERGQEYRLNFPTGTSASAVINFESPTRKFVDVDGKLELLQENLEYAGHSCLTSGVVHMYEHIMKAPRPVHVVATGPATDVSCLVRNYKGADFFAKIETVYFLGGRRWGKGLHLCNQGAERCLPGLSDFNVRLNPIAVHTLLQAGLPQEKIKFVPFELSGQHETSVALDDFVRNGSPEHCNTTERTFLVNNLVLRAEWYDRVLHMGKRIWLWDLIPFYLAVEPAAIKCRPAKAAIVWCESKPGYKRFHAPGKKHDANSCVDHSVLEDSNSKKPFPSMVHEAAQLWLCAENDNCSEPQEVQRLPVTICDEWNSGEARTKFMAEVMRDAFY